MPLDSGPGIFMLFINGRKMSSQDFVHVAGTNTVTVNNTLEVEDEIDIIYKRIIE